MFSGKGVLKICSKFTGEHPCRSVISIKLQSNFIEIALRHGCSPVNLLHIFRTHFSRNTFGWLLLFKCTTNKAHEIIKNGILLVFSYFCFLYNIPITITFYFLYFCVNVFDVFFIFKLNSIISKSAALRYLRHDVFAHDM